MCLIVYSDFSTTSKTNEGGLDFTQRDGFSKGVAGVMAQIFGNSGNKQTISGRHINGIVEDFALTPSCLTDLRKIESALISR